MIIYIIWIFLAFLIGKSASANGRSFWLWFTLGIIIDPILAFIIYKIVGENR
jgi:hypothetical protein